MEGQTKENCDDDNNRILLPPFSRRFMQAISFPLLFFMMLIWPLLWWPCVIFLPTIWFGASGMLYFIPFCVPYLIWWACDRETPRHGSRPSNWVKSWPMFKALAEYLPNQIVKTADLPADRNYVLGIHPHGPGAIFAFLVCCTNATDFPALFPDIHVKLCTISPNFWPIPFRREFFMALGLIPCDFESLANVLNCPPQGNAVAISIGGMKESKLTTPNTLVLAERRGFIRLAMKCGADIVPIFQFGYDKIYRISDDQFKFPLPYGISFLSMLLPEKWAQKLPAILLRYGIFPFRTKFATVVGSPLQVRKNADPSKEELDAVHAEYCSRLKELFNKHKCELGELPEDTELEFI